MIMSGGGDKKMQTEFQIGPMSILHQAVGNHHQILVSCRNNKKLLGHIKAFDRHMNLVMENVREMWQELPRKGKGREDVPEMHQALARDDDFLLHQGVSFTWTPKNYSWPGKMLLWTIFTPLT